MAQLSGKSSIVTCLSRNIFVPSHSHNDISSGLFTLRALFSTWAQIIMLDTSECTGNACIVPVS